MRSGASADLIGSLSNRCGMQYVVSVVRFNGGFHISHRCRVQSGVSADLTGPVQF